MSDVRRGGFAAASTAAITAAIAAGIVLAGCSGGNASPSAQAPAALTSTTIAAAEGPVTPATAGAGPATTAVVRATGAGTCAFLSTDDVRQATGAPSVELRQQLGPNGRPGCEWTLGDPGKVIQLEFQVGTGAASSMPAQGEAVSGPWKTGRWVASTRTLWVDRDGLLFLVRVTDPDPANGRDISTKVATLASQRA